MLRVGEAIKNGVEGARITPRILMPENIASKLDVEFEGARIKIEVTPTSRGCVYDPVTMSVSLVLGAPGRSNFDGIALAFARKSAIASQASGLSS